LAAVVTVSASTVPLGSANADSATSHQRGSQGEIYFFAKPSSPVALVGQRLPSPNPLVVRPAGFPLFEDGQWVLEKLHWTGWGSPVALAKGLSSSSNGDPNAEEGKRIVTRAKVRLSQPGVFHGHRVYRCIRVTVPPPAHYPAACLQRSHRYIGLLTPGSGDPVGVPGTTANAGLTDFLSPDKKVWCLLRNETGFCGVGGPSSDNGQLAAYIFRSGRVDTCSVAVPSLEESCLQNWDGSAPVLHYGERTRAKGIACSSAKNGITCIKVTDPGRGHGFRVNKDEAVQIGS
jgi:hypothetical protein